MALGEALVLLGFRSSQGLVGLVVERFPLV